ncbi:AMP-dependent synthetase/ligase [Haliangium sp.]|uniref:AMP-dependent synthetase/ligase n=1 Tax=Haliangium sp. TaxID=2663208 RepID=UPI003D0E62C2
MDITPYLDIQPAPQAVFGWLAKEPARADLPRFHVPAEEGWHAVTWGDFAEQIRRVAVYLRERGFRPGERAAIFAPNRVSWAAAALGIQAAGGVMVPVYPASTADQLAYVLTHSDAKALFVDAAPLWERALSALAAMADDASGQGRRPTLERALGLGELPADVGESAGPAGVEVHSWDQVMSIGAGAHARAPSEFTATLEAVDLDAPGLMLYTSGTSGNPKGVPLSHRNVGTNARDWLVNNGPLLEEGMVDLLWLPMSHIFGFGEMCLGNTLGFTTYMTTPQAVLAQMPQVQPSVFMSVPAYWEKLAQAALAGAEADRGAHDARARLHQVTGGKLRFCLSGGAGLKREVKELFYDAGLLIIEGYGLTETSPTLTLNRPDDFRFDTVGKPLPSVELRLDEDGEILARGPNVFAGYHKDPQATAACFTDDGWFRTGDIGRFTDDGFLQIVDRKKDILVTSGGKNVPPANIELRFRDDPSIEHVVVYGDGKKYLVAGVWLAAAAVADLDPAARQAQVSARVDEINAGLARHETIKRFFIADTPLTVEGGMLTASLKVRRKHVYQAFRDQFEALYAD